MLASLLAQFALLNASLLASVHSSLFPFPVITSIHAARVSLAYRSNVKRVSRSEMEKYHSQGSVEVKPSRTWLLDMAGFLVMAWGGSFVSNYLVHSTPPQLLTFNPLIQYLSVHVFITALFELLPEPSASTLDTILPLLDGATRTGALVGGLTLASKHFPSPLPPQQPGTDSLTSSSIILPLVLGTASASFGGQLAGTLNVFSSNWSVSTPPILKAQTLLASTDVWSPLLASFLHGLFNSYHPVYIKLRTMTGLSHDGDIVLGLVGSKALVSLVITLAFAWRAVCLHWLVSPGAEVKQSSEQVRGKSKIENRKVAVNGSTNGVEIKSRN